MVDAFDWNAWNTRLHPEPEPESDDKIDADRLDVGARYAVRWDDCCAAGSFTATVVAKAYDTEEPDFLDAVEFDNGVRIETPLYGFTFEAT